MARGAQDQRRVSLGGDVPVRATGGGPTRHLSEWTLGVSGVVLGV
jgi:hypothetical protein